LYLDEALYRQLSPRIQRLYADYFSPLSKLRRRRRQVTSQVKRAARRWIDERLRRAP
jgi:hypothetical protein